MKTESGKAYIALGLVSFFWGTTYLGIRIALDSFSPALMVCLRNLISGAVTLGVAAMIGAHLPRGRASRADRARKVADVCTTLPSVSAGGRGGRDLRSQLV